MQVLESRISYRAFNKFQLALQNFAAATSPLTRLGAVFSSQPPRTKLCPMITQQTTSLEPNRGPPPAYHSPHPLPMLFSSDF